MTGFEMLPEEQPGFAGIGDGGVDKGVTEVESAKGSGLRAVLGSKTIDHIRSEPRSLSPQSSKGKQVEMGKGSSDMRDDFYHPHRVHLGGTPANMRSWAPSDVDDDEDIDYDDEFDEHRLSRNLVGRRDIRDTDARLEYDHGYRCETERDSRLSERRITSVALESGRQMLGSGHMISRVQTAVKLPYCSDCGKAHPLPDDAEYSECFDERSRYRDRVGKSGLSSLEVYEDREGNVIYRNDAYGAPSDSRHRKLPCCSHHHENISRSSTVHPRNEFVSSYGGDEPFGFIDEYSNRGKHIKSSYTDPGNQRMFADSQRDWDMRESDKRISRQTAHGNFRDNYTDKLFVKRQKLPYEFDGHLPNKLLRMVPPQDDMHRGHPQLVDHAKTSSRNMILHPPMDFKDRVVDDFRQSHASVQRISSSKQATKCLGCGCAHSVHETRLSPHPYARRNLHQQQDCHNSHLSPEYNYGELTDALDPGDIYSRSTMTDYEEKLRRAAARVQTMEDEEELEHGIGESANEIHERKYSVSQDFAERNHRYPITHKRKIVEYKDLDNGEEMMNGEDLTDLYSYEDQQIKRLAHNKEKYHLHEGKHAVRFVKNDHRMLKSFDKFGPSGSYNEHRFSQKKAFHEIQDIKKGHNYSHKNRVKSYEELAGDVEFSAEPDAHKGSEELETLVHESFLKYSRDVNLNPWVQKRYRAQGKLGTLFCVVCGKSNSKEFQDTHGLAKHCIMSRRVTLKAQHFGLHKAICVLLGWSIATSDPFNWAATVLPQEEARAAREDLILWPPIVIIHNISMVVDNPEEQKVIHVNSIESFLRGKGFAMGKMTVCVGKPADQSVILAKFLGTFSGLESARRLHKYLADNKRGRPEFMKMASCRGDGSSRGRARAAASAQAVSQGDEIEENILYGYMGVADDMDRLDFGSKKFVSLKSGREIQDLANGPVKAKEK